MISRPTYFPILALVAFFAPVSTGTAQQACNETTLNAAANTYDVGRFARTFDLLQPCLPSGFATRDQRAGAYRLMALSYIARDSLEKARQSVRMLLRTDSRYRADREVDPRLFADLVSDLRPRWYTWLWRGNAWYQWAGRAVIVGSVASLPFLLKGGEPELPPPPVFPEP